MSASRLLVVLSTVLFLGRLVGAAMLGFGDAEALYASYANHLAPLYVDHPGLVGWIAFVLGRGAAPSPLVAHLFTAIAATAVPFVAAWAARRHGASADRAAWAGVALVAAPEISIGLFGLNPDLFLCLAWLGALGFLAGTTPRDAALAAGLAAVGLFAKVSMICLVPAFFFARHRAFRAAAALPLAAALVLLVLDARLGFPMLRHRLVDTQGASAVSILNLGRTLLGQLAYLSPVLAVAAVVAGTRLVRRRDAEELTLRVACLVPLATLLPLSVWSRVSEPHWIAPAFLPLALAHARTPLVSPALARWSVGVGLGLVAAAHLWILTDLAPATLGSLYEPRYDLANDLRVWPAVHRSLRKLPPAALVVTPHWTVAAQIHAARPDLAVVTAAGRDDFTRWFGAATRAAESDGVVLWVTDDRFFDVRPEPDREVLADEVITLVRAGRIVRKVRLLAVRPAARPAP